MCCPLCKRAKCRVSVLGNISVGVMGLLRGPFSLRSRALSTGVRTITHSRDNKLQNAVGEFPHNVSSRSGIRDGIRRHIGRIDRDGFRADAPPHSAEEREVNTLGKEK